MNSAIVLVACLVTAATSPDVEVTSLNGDVTSGALISIDSATVELESAATSGSTKKTTSLARKELLAIHFPNTARQRRLKGVHVALTDGTLLLCKGVSVKGFNANLNSHALGKVELKSKELRSLLFKRLDQSSRKQWNGFLARKLRDDMLVIRKDNKLDFLTGVIGDIDEKTIQFLFDDGSSIPVQKTKVFGIIFQRDAVKKNSDPIQCEFATGERVGVRELKLSESGFEIKHTFGTASGVPVTAVTSLDLSAGKLAYLSKMEPQNVEYAACISSTGDEKFDSVFEYRKDQNMYGNPIRLGKRTFSSGLCLHADTVLSYRLGREYKTFQATAGIDETAGNSYGNVHLTIIADGTPIYQADFLGTEGAKKINLDVSKYRVLEIQVGCGKDGWDIGDNLNFGDARLLK